MDTSLNTDTLHGVQPTLVGQYMINTSQAPMKTNCGSDGLHLNYSGLNCDVRFRKNDIVDTESVLFGLDKRITKQEPPRNVTVEKIKEMPMPQMKDTYNAPFEPKGTRKGRSCNMLSGIHIDRYETPMHEAQNLKNIVFDEPLRGGLNTRMVAKDCAVTNCGDMLKLKPGYGTRCFES